MIKRLQELARCTSLNPSLCYVKWAGNGAGNAAKKGEEGGTRGVGDTWVVCSSGDTVVSLNPLVPSEENRSVSPPQLASLGLRSHAQCQHAACPL